MSGNIRYLGRRLISLSLIGTMVAPWVADWNSTHIFSAVWAPHARFHGVVALVMSASLSMFGLWATWRTSKDPQFGSLVGAVVPLAYWGAFFVAVLVPGTGVEDPEHPIHRVAGLPVNVVAAIGQVLASVAGWVIDRAFNRPQV